MVRLTIKQAELLLAAICKYDSRLCDQIKSLVNLKRSGKLNLLYSDGDQVTLNRTTVAGGVPIGAIINPLSCSVEHCTWVFGVCIC